MDVQEEEPEVVPEVILDDMEIEIPEVEINTQNLLSQLNQSQILDECYVEEADCVKKDLPDS